MRVVVVVDLGFGDAGKGTIVDYFARAMNADLVVRFNGGAQAGHNVVTDDGRHHTFAQFGSGSFVAGCRTHLTASVVLHPGALVVEERHLRRAGIDDGWERISIAPDALMTTPFHQALGRLRELARARQHGTCGVGVGETVGAALRHAGARCVLRARDLLDESLGERAERARIELLEEMATIDARGEAADAERRLLEDRSVVGRWLETIEPLLSRAHAIVREPAPFRRVVLEGAQGVLLDEDWGFHPHTTWSHTTTENADAWLAAMGIAADEALRLGVLRAFMTRHGPGPFPSECRQGELAHLEEPHNPDEGWQGRFRRGWPDPILWRYALRVAGPLDALAVTHLDRLEAVSLAVRDYGGEERALDQPLAPTDLVERERLSQRLAAVDPTLDRAPSRPEAFMDWLEERLGLPVAIASFGPAASAKRERPPP